MKIVLYNIGYGTGLKGSWKDYFLKFWRYLWAPIDPIGKISELLKKQKADVICLLETDIGSIRAHFQSQVKQIAKKLFIPFHKSSQKYHPRAWYKNLPFFKHQHDAIFSRQKGKLFKHYLKSGMKNLVQEFVVGNVSIFVVHLSVLRKSVRKMQMRELSKIIKRCKRPHIVCGDFNIFDGLSEVKEFIKENALKAVQNQATFPSVEPKRPLDLILACKNLQIKAAGVLNDVMWSDHLPVWVEIDN